MPATIDSGMLLPCGTLRDSSDEAPTLEEHHPGGTSLWSADAPIAPRYFPYNLCSVWLCSQCRRLFLRYTEYGGYYEEERIREVRAGLVV